LEQFIEYIEEYYLAASSLQQVFTDRKIYFYAALSKMSIYLANTIPSFIGNIYQYISIQGQTNVNITSDGFNGLLQVKSAIITDFIKIIISIFIIAGHRWLASFSEYFKVEGKRDIKEDEDQ
jgi:hypothetical protein